MSSSSITIFLFILLILFLIGAGFFLYIYWWLIQRAAPKLDGEVHVTGMERPVEVRRDKHGIPHIFAENRADLFRALGWVHAQDRLWQMEQNRRIAQGRLAEIFGVPALEADRFSRIVGFQRAAEAELAVLDDETRTTLDWYVEGINAYMTARPGRMAAEFNLLRFKPEPWRTVDVLAFTKVFGWGLSLNWESELTRVRLLQQLDPYTVAQLDPNYPAQTPLILEAVGSAEQTRMLDTAGLLLNQLEEVRNWLGSSGGQGSNSWVVAPRHSLNRRPLLCADPHLNVQLPSMVYEAHMAYPGFEVSGATVPGAPGVLIGHNTQIAWGMTNSMVDTQDLYVERAHPEDPTRFAFGADWEQATIHEEIIRVRRGAAVIEQVVVTRHGPLINRLIRGSGDSHARSDALASVPLALRWTGHTAGHSLRALLKLNEAQDWEEFTQALSDWHVAPQNVTFADARGNIGYVLAGTVPIREENLGLVPAPGWDGKHEWRGFIPTDELPRLYNPESGLIVAANNKIVGDDYPYFLGVEFDPGWRAARIEEMLLEKDRHTIREMEEMQQDNLSKFAQALNPWITLLRSEDPWEKTALQLLRKWNLRMDTDSPAALCYSYILGHLLDMTFGEKLGSSREGYFGISSTPLFLLHGFKQRAETHLLELLNDHEESIWYTDVQKRRQRPRDEMLQEALSRAMKSVRRIHGDSSLRWAWGRTHQVRFAHPLGRARLVGRFFDRGPLPIGGDATTPNQTRAAPQIDPGLVQVIPVYRQIFEVGTWDRAQSILAGGQSGHPLSRLYDDQIIMWREGVYHAMPWSREAVEAATEHRLLLTPT